MYTEDAIRYFGTRANIARKLKGSRTKSAVYQWGKLVPLLVAHHLEDLSKGALKVNLRAYEKPVYRRSKQPLRASA